VTGGGTGLGREICMAFAQSGAHLVIAGRRPGPIEEVAVEAGKLGVKALALPTDITDSGQVKTLIEQTVDNFGRVDILVNNAGLAKGVDPAPEEALKFEPKPIWEWTDEEWRYSIDTNLTGAFYGCREAVRYMVKQKSGKIINMASVGGLRGIRGSFGYCSAKGAIIQLTRSLAVTLAGDNVQVNCIAPGFLETTELPADVKTRSRRFFPFGRFGLPREIGPLCIYLASAASDYVTGECFVIDGAASAGYAPTGYAPT
jgi:NAD(P)-dependent dehydrogenase (short-subunit alcohol dehydrogenase family)